MNQVILNPDEEYYGGRGRSSGGGLAGWLVRLSGGRIADNRAANRYLMVFALIIFAVAVVIFFRA
ncbi:MAG: hypothetical protein AAB468_01370 [Patescibacteria group bacterium]